MADSKLTAEYRCGYCYLEFNSMTDPRELPCHHVFCITCLQGDYTDNNNICCRSCQRVYNMKTFDHLPTTSLDTQVVVDTLSSLTCDCHNCDGQNAVSYCIVCAHKMCDTHQQAHSSFHGDKHEVISISTYEMSPGTYKKVLCEHHGVELQRACQKCSCLFCGKCDLNEKTCSGTKHRRHIFGSLDELKEEITVHFNRLLQSASNKLTEICKLDKHIWKLLDDEEIECKKRIEMIERICDEQIEVMREESEKLKEQIYEYQKTLTDQVELYNTELMDKKEKLEESRTKVHKWLRESHVADKLQQKQQMVDELRNNTDIELDCELTKTPIVVCPDRQLSLNISLINCPTSITFKSEQPTNSWCYSACYKEDGDLLLGCDDGVRLLSQDRMQMSKYETSHADVISVAVHRRNVFLLHQDDTTKTVEMCLPSVKQREKLFSFQYPGNTASSAAVNDLYVVAVNPETTDLVLYEFLTKQTTVLYPLKPPCDVHFLPGGDLLVISNLPSGHLTRYRLKDGRLAEIWTCERLDHAQSSFMDSNGIIYVSTTEELKTLYVLSPDGVMLQQIKNDKLPGVSGQISIRGTDELAVPSWNNKSVCLFKVNC